MDIQSIWMQCFSFFPFLVGLPFLEPLGRKPGSIAAGTHSSNAPGFVTRFARAGALAHVPCSHMPPAFIATGSTLAPRQRFQPHTRPTVWTLQGDSVGRMAATTINSSKLLDLYLSLPRHWAFPGIEPSQALSLAKCTWMLEPITPGIPKMYPRKFNENWNASIVPHGTEMQDAWCNANEKRTTLPKEKRQAWNTSKDMNAGPCRPKNNLLCKGLDQNDVMSFTWLHPIRIDRNKN